MNSDRSPSINDAAKPTHEQVSLRAELLWRAQGCPSGKDEEIWLAAEAQLAEEARDITRPSAAAQSEQMSPVTPDDTPKRTKSPNEPAAGRSRSRRTSSSNS
jgi:hypothetical protein